MASEHTTGQHRVVIIGGGFGGLNVARSLRKVPVDITLIDRQNFHLFQPLLYQVATGSVGTGDIAAPLREILRRQRNARVLMDEVTDIDARHQRVVTESGSVPYDTLVVAAGVRNHYHGRDGWAKVAGGLKTIEDAVAIRNQILRVFEMAELETDADARRALMTFVVIGAGPTGVELAGALAELAHRTLVGEFRSIDPASARIVLVDAANRVLREFPESLSAKAKHALERLGVEVHLSQVVKDITTDGIDLETDAGRQHIPARSIVWAAGVAGASLGAAVERATGCQLDRLGRVMVQSDLTVPGHPEIFVVGDLAHVEYHGQALPCVAPPAIQGGRYIARLIRARLAGRTLQPFTYFDKGMLATIGRSAAVAEFRGFKFWGFLAWVVWLVIHIFYLIGFENRIVVLVQWANTYVARRRGSRVILDVTASRRWSDGSP
jgi:NADH dehydrogenase